MFQIGVIGSSTTKDKKVLQIAEETGREIAKKGCILICGGRAGVMEACAKGAKEAGGTTVGILPFNTHEDANKFIDIKVPTGIGWARNQIVVLASDGVIVVGGESGTLSEMCFAWINNKPIVAISPSGGFAKEFANRRMDGKRNDTILEAKDAKEAIEKIINILKGK